MAIQTVNLGDPPTGTGGDTVRQGFDKTNQNIQELDQRATAQQDTLDQHAAALYQHTQDLTAEAQARAQGDSDLSGRIDDVNIYIPDMHRRAVEAATGGLCTVLYTATGKPSYFRVIPRFNCEDIAPGGELGTGTHEAFIRNGTAVSEIFVGMYLMSTVAGEGVSQPRATPQWSISYSVAQSRIQACGPGFDLMTCWDWAAVVFWSMANGFDATGNTNYGRHHDKRWETGARVDGGEPGDTTTAGAGQTLTGTGPLGWRHDGTPAGIADMVGNLWEWQGGFKTVDGRAFLAPDNGDHAEAEWGDTGFDMPGSQPWGSIDATAAPGSLKRALIVPNGALDPTGQYYINQEGERLPLRGGSRNNGGNAGLGALNLSYERAGANAYIGARPRFRNP
ncbi:hypothetical protein [Alloalcanivorax xenomutans]